MDRGDGEIVFAFRGAWELELELLRGGPLASFGRRLPGSASVAAYSPSGEVVRTIWPNAERLPADEIEDTSGSWMRARVGAAHSGATR